MPLTKINLSLIEGKLSSLSDTPYFSLELKSYTKQLQRVAIHTSSQKDKKQIDYISDYLWSAIQYLDGSTTKVLPYEVVFCLEAALKDWTSESYLITTAVLHAKDFFFQGMDEGFYTVAKVLCGEDFKYRLIQIALPDLYRHKPLYNSALYHELGHFIDVHKGITDYLVLHNPRVAIPALDTKPANWTDAHYENVRRRHLMEYFADLFAACYIGPAINSFLSAFAPDHPASFSHPSTKHRVENVEALLSGKKTPLIDAFNGVLTALKLPTLEKKYKAIDLSTALDNARPFSLASIEEVHGVFDSGWNYLHDALEKKKEPWSKLEENKIEKVINDLVEKSIRNFMVRELWKYGTA